MMSIASRMRTSMRTLRNRLINANSRLAHSKAGAVLVPIVKAVTPLGWLLIVAAMTCWIAGSSFHWIELKVIAIAALIALLVAVLCALHSARLHAHIYLAKPRVHVGENAQGAVIVKTAGAKTASATIEFPVGKETAVFFARKISQERPHEESFQIPAQRRGVINIGPVQAVKSDPIGIISRTNTIAQSQELFVHPRVVLLGTDAIGFLKDVEGITAAKLSSSDVSFHALREYAPGDDRRSIHWRTTARTGKLMVRQFEETMRAHMLILLSTLRSDYTTVDDFEIAVSAAASLGVSAFGQERQVSIWTSEGELSFVSAMTMLDALSRVELIAEAHPQNEAYSIADLAVRASEAESGISVAAILSGNVDPLELRAASRALPLGVRSFALRHQGALPTQRHTVGDLIVMDLNTVDDLPLVMRSIQ